MNAYKTCKNNSKCPATLDKFDAKCIAKKCNTFIVNVLKDKIKFLQEELKQYKNIIKEKNKYTYQPHKIVVAESMISSYNDKIKELNILIKADLEKQINWIKYVVI